MSVENVDKSNKSLIKRLLSKNDKILQVVRLTKKAHIPTKGSPFSAGYDLYSAADIVVKPRSKAVVPTDLKVAVPPGTYGRIAPRSGLAVKHFIDVGAGVVDEDYRGPLYVVLFNHNDTPFDVKIGDRVAQFICEKIVCPGIVEVDCLEETDRGEGNFGSTGTN